MNKLAWIASILFIFMIVAKSRQSSDNRRIDPWQPLRYPVQGEGCQCPYDIDSRDYLCGDRSAYVKFGGTEPQCFVRDL